MKWDVASRWTWPFNLALSSTVQNFILACRDVICMEECEQKNCCVDAWVFSLQKSHVVCHQLSIQCIKIHPAAPLSRRTGISAQAAHSQRLSHRFIPIWHKKVPPPKQFAATSYTISGTNSMNMRTVFGWFKREWKWSQEMVTKMYRKSSLQEILTFCKYM